MNRGWWLAAVLSTTGCGMLSGVDRFVEADCVEPTCGDARVDPADVSVPQDVAEESNETSTDSGSLPETEPSKCVGTPGKVVSMGAWSIDATEVTNAQYAAFLAAVESTSLATPAYCSWNTSYVPSSAWPAPEGRCEHPVVHVDWCDAWAYCAWAKKRLCGSPTGGPTAFDGSGPTSIATSQWFATCSVNGIARYPYGDTWTPKTCVDNSYDDTGGTGPTDVSRPVASATSCHGVAGSYANVFDLVGNVREWEDDCDGTKDGGDNCRTRGGSFTEAGDKASCATTLTLKRNTAADNLGFRCCSL